MDRSFLTASIPHIIAQLTNDEKAELLSGKDSWQTRDIPRLNIPSVKVTDGPCGARGDSFVKRTPAVILPCETAVASTFSRQAASSVGSLLAQEAKARQATCLLAPGINTPRSPLGGRTFEYYSEDTTLAGHLAAAVVNGLQQNGVSATIKHFVANDQEDGRQGYDAVIDPRTLREVYLRPFQIVQRLASPWAYMPSYNKLNGLHCSENPWLLQDLLRQEWRFEGLVMSDWGGTYSTVEAMNAGLDIEMPGPGAWRTRQLIGLSVACFKLDPRTIDNRVEEVLRWVQKLARLNPDIAYNPAPVERTRFETQDKDAALARSMAAESIVLLKNNDVLPLSPRAQKLAVIGPAGKRGYLTGGGSAQLEPSWSSAPLSGLVSNCPSPDIEINYAPGCINHCFLPVLDDNFTCTDGAPGFDLLYYPLVDGEPAVKPLYHDRHNYSDMLYGDWTPGPGLLPDYVTELRAVFTAPATGEYEFGVCCVGTAILYVEDVKLLDMTMPLPRGKIFFGNGTEEHRKSLWVEAGRTYSIRLVNDTRRPTSGVNSQTQIFNAFRLGASPKVSEDDLLLEAESLAAQTDVAVVCVGLGPEWESESNDRQTLSLTSRQDELVARVAKVAKKTVVVVQAGSAISMPWLQEVDAVVYAWYGGNEGGNAIADVIYGKYNPSGRLPITFPKREIDIPAAFNFRNARTQVMYGEGIWVGYKHYNARGIEPLFPFGHGLSYTTFDYSELQVSAADASPDDWKLEVSLVLTNTGDVLGDHSVHVYLSPPPLVPMGLVHAEHSLQGFTKEYHVAPGESRKVRLTLDKYAVSHWDELWKTWRAEPGEWRVMVGRTAQSMWGNATFNIEQRFEWRGL
ncbi:hypothetical protein VHUM_02721 [Vanrija humicola]|uniref:beta-glucosidase n=1 Tax=Vanrija humicola TaxID=5417 RepID=A0A7D8ZP03_VANHU|nr:hypothetical protein VHUM_02721 [Vanrija humicola]